MTPWTALRGTRPEPPRRNATERHTTYTPLMTAVPCVDWQVAAATGGLLVPPGIDLDRAAVGAAVDDLRACAERAVTAVAVAAKLPAPPSAQVWIVGRATWVRAATDMARAMLTAVGQQPPVALGEKVGARLAGLQLGSAFAFVATRILGQFDPYSATPRLLLVAPNIVAAERAMGVEPHGFRQWVCLHEQTHRAQFHAAPWLPEHLLGLMAQLFDANDDADAGASGHASPPARTAAGPAARLMSPAQLTTFDRITAVMSLLEGHAEVMMDRAAPGLVPQIDRLRASMEQRRDAAGPMQLLSRLLGLRAKREQYLHGATFCRAVIDRAGPATLNLALAAPHLLPDLPELYEPQRWLGRVSQQVA